MPNLWNKRGVVPERYQGMSHIVLQPIPGSVCPGYQPFITPPTSWHHSQYLASACNPNTVHSLALWFTLRSYLSSLKTGRTWKLKVTKRRVWQQSFGFLSDNMCTGKCSRCVAVTLYPLAAISIICNIVLFFPHGETKFAQDGHITEEVKYMGGLVGGGIMVSCLFSGCGPALSSNTSRSHQIKDNICNVSFNF